ncbi:DMT family transporter [Silicimonas algicola]|uniref:Drug/metabolite transporter (DMT)-like permease n=1 Tax=Silicimonas algicola TaxID=1826607 RepID=A0A316G8E7_9RHOB|nr:DMT family transporter [Silicimonas algicola]PWK57249.1 drug/metabolite transporter (DMT)-like permease [Silicimonas algicola]
MDHLAGGLRRRDRHVTGRTAGLYAALALMGAGWGLSQPLSKIAVGGGHGTLGLMVWQLVIAATLLTAVQAALGARLRTDRAALLVYAAVALTGTVIPNAFSFEAVRHLPSGLVSILLSLVPIFAFPLALALRTERYSPVRAAGLLLGLAGVLMIVGPEASLPDRAMIVFVPLALVAPFFYALEGNIVAKWGTAGLTPVGVLHGAVLLSLVLVVPMAFATGQWIDPRPPWGAPEAALVLSSVINIAVYTGYVWMVGRAGAVFAVQVSYLVTGFGVLWAMAILSETFSPWVWAAMAVMLLGTVLVQPKKAGASLLAAPDESGETRSDA